MSDTPVEVALDVGAQHGEGPLWDAESGQLWWVDITGQMVHSFDPATGRDRSWSTPAQPGGVLLDSAGSVLVAAPEGLAELDQDTGRLHLRVPVEQEKPENRANDVKVDTRGRAWVGTMPFDKRPGNAALYRVDGDEVTCVVAGLTISNGPAFDESSGRLYLADTARCIVDVFDFDTAAGSATRRRRFLDFSDEQVWPDGMTVDDAGMFWVALGRAGAVHATGPTARSTAWSRCRRATPPRWPSAAPTGPRSTSRPPGSTSTRTAAPPNLWPARSSGADPV
jgi:sugar lactone lactonase YvrE